METYRMICLVDEVISLGLKAIIKGKLPVKALPQLLKYKLYTGKQKRKIKKAFAAGNRVCHGPEFEKALDILHPWLANYESELLQMKRMLEGL